VSLKDRASLLSGMTLVLRHDGDPDALIAPLRSALHDTDPTVPFQPLESMTDVVSETLVFERMESWLFGIFSGLALALAMVGLYGLVSHEVEQAARDIGVRMALGATRDQILGMVMGRVAWMLGAGVVAGTMLTILVRKIIGIVIYFEPQREAGVLAVLSLLILLAGLIAGLIPAARAASVDPMQALRNE